MIIDLILFLVFLVVLIKCADYAIRYSSRVAKALSFPEFIVSFFIIAFISVLPEAIISIVSAFNGEPQLALGTLLGSNVTDLTLVFGIVALFSMNGVKVESKILGDNFYFLILLLFPLLLGFDGMFSRVDGAILILLGILFFTKIYFDSRRFRKKFNHTKKSPVMSSFFLLVFSLLILLLSAYLTVKFAVDFAHAVKMPTFLIGLTVIALGTCLPELIFSVRAVRSDRDELALGDILGTVVADATIVLGIVAIISPFSYNPYNIYITGAAMFLAGVFLTIFMRSGKSINLKEGWMLIGFYAIFVLVEFMASRFLTG